MKLVFPMKYVELFPYLCTFTWIVSFEGMWGAWKSHVILFDLSYEKNQIGVIV